MALKIALIPGDGIGKEVVPEGVRTIRALAKKFGCGPFHRSTKTFALTNTLLTSSPPTS